ncbi:hypothetical protein B0H19DRAFT_1259991 [Mycena capillaripes]|nr:hypothetical protein B0H19DRAFT_1259991 [Mycena capillaripes]
MPETRRKRAQSLSQPARTLLHRDPRPPEHQQLVLDVTDDSQLKEVVQHIPEQGGRIENNAGVLAPGTSYLSEIDWSAENVEAVYYTNVSSTLRAYTVIVPHMVKRRMGAIIDMGSIPHALDGVLRLLQGRGPPVLSMKCKPFNVHVMLVAPGSVQSKIIDKQDGLALAPTSLGLCGGFFHNIRARLEVAPYSAAMPANQFAEGVVFKTLRSSPPRYILTGGNATLFRFLAERKREWTRRCRNVRCFL